MYNKQSNNEKLINEMNQTSLSAESARINTSKSCTMLTNR